jgi:hypothetical protein
MDTFVENTGAAEQEKKAQAAPTENEKQIQVPIENAETASAPLTEEMTAWQGEEPERQIKIVRTEEKPDPLGKRIASLPMNEMKAGYDYAFGKGRISR